MVNDEGENIFKTILSIWSDDGNEEISKDNFSFWRYTFVKYFKMIKERTFDKIKLDEVREMLQMIRIEEKNA